MVSILPKFSVLQLRTENQGLNQIKNCEEVLEMITEFIYPENIFGGLGGLNVWFS